MCSGRQPCTAMKLRLRGHCDWDRRLPFGGLPVPPLTSRENANHSVALTRSASRNSSTPYHDIPEMQADPPPCQPHPKNCIAHPKNCAASIPNGIFSCSPLRFISSTNGARTEQAGRSPGATAEKAVHQTGAIMIMHHLLTIVIAMLQEQLLWHDRHVAIHSLFAQAEKTKRG
jgi:hypothetical protein